MIASWIKVCVSLSSDEVASSNKIISVSWINALAIASLCLWPPERVTPPSPTTESYLSGKALINSSRHANLQASTISSSVTFFLTSLKLSLILILKMYGFCEIIVILFLIDFSSNVFISLPSINIWLSSTLYNLQRRENIVVLPTPLFPTKPTVSFALILKFSPFNTSFSS